MTTADLDSLIREAQADAIRTLRELCAPLPPAPAEEPHTTPDAPSTRRPNPLEARRLALRERAIRLRAATTLLRHKPNQDGERPPRPTEQSDRRASSHEPAPAQPPSSIPYSPTPIPSALPPSADPAILARLLKSTPLQRHLNQSHIDLKKLGVKATPDRVATHIRGIISYEQAFKSPYPPQPSPPSRPTSAVTQNASSRAADSSPDHHP